MKSCRNPDLLNSDLLNSERDAHPWAWSTYRQPLLLTAQVRFRKPRQRDSGFPSTFAADGGARPNSGGTPFRQPCPAYPSTKGWKAPQERFSEECLRISTSSGNAFLYSSTASVAHNHARILQHTASLDVLAEPNYYSKLLQTSSTRVFASYSRTHGSGWSSVVEPRIWMASRMGNHPKQVRNAGHQTEIAYQLADSASSLYTTSFPIH